VSPPSGWRSPFRRERLEYLTACSGAVALARVPICRPAVLATFTPPVGGVAEALRKNRPEDRRYLALRTRRARRFTPLQAGTEVARRRAQTQSSRQRRHGRSGAGARSGRSVRGNILAQTGRPLRETNLSQRTALPFLREYGPKGKNTGAVGRRIGGPSHRRRVRNKKEPIWHLAYLTTSPPWTRRTN
jgi:hypothetical protein